ncbi:MAG TPA: glycosyl hydrolase 108 family protein, partial [Candidatus Saccharimonadales bacterium]|nr:glycosyl hydrolase 108 family protein [Candidatus Saccharimonadales bacterium]
MLRNFERSLSGVLAHEGGYVNDPADKGGPTNKGITIATFRRYVDKSGTIDDLKNLTTTQAATVYRKQYWDAVCGSELPDGVDYSVFDFAVNSGSERAAKYLQTIVGAKTDGEIGPRTLAAVKATDPTVIIN